MTSLSFIHLQGIVDDVYPPVDKNFAIWENLIQHGKVFRFIAF